MKPFETLVLSLCLGCLLGIMILVADIHHIMEAAQ